MRLGHRAEGSSSLERLLETLEALDAGDNDRCWQVQRVLEALDGRYGPRFQDEAICEALHTEHADVLFHQFWKHQSFEAAIVRVHHVERHLHGVEDKTPLSGDLEHVQVDSRVLVPRDSG